MERRNTIQRDLVLSAVRKLGNHATADEIYAFVSKTHPSIGKGTVYRNLKILADENQISIVHLPEGADRFDHIVKKHCHVRCIKCGRLFDLEMNDMPALNDKIKDAHGIEILDYNIIFNGVCQDCRQNDGEIKL